MEPESSAVALGQPTTYDPVGTWDVTFVTEIEESGTLDVTAKGKKFVAELDIQNGEMTLKGKRQKSDPNLIFFKGKGNLPEVGKFRLFLDVQLTSSTTFTAVVQQVAKFGTLAGTATGIKQETAASVALGQPTTYDPVGTWDVTIVREGTSTGTMDITAQGKKFVAELEATDVEITLKGKRQKSDPNLIFFKGKAKDELFGKYKLFFDAQLLSDTTFTAVVVLKVAKLPPFEGTSSGSKQVVNSAVPLGEPDAFDPIGTWEIAIMHDYTATGTMDITAQGKKFVAELDLTGEEATLKGKRQKSDPNLIHFKGKNKDVLYGKYKIFFDAQLTSDTTYTAVVVYKLAKGGPSLEGSSGGVKQVVTSAVPLGQPDVYDPIGTWEITFEGEDQVPGTFDITAQGKKFVAELEAIGVVNTLKGKRQKSDPNLIFFKGKFKVPELGKSKLFMDLQLTSDTTLTAVAAQVTKFETFEGTATGIKLVATSAVPLGEPDAFDPLGDWDFTVISPNFAEGTLSIQPKGKKFLADLEMGNLDTTLKGKRQKSDPNLIFFKGAVKNPEYGKIKLFFDVQLTSDTAFTADFVEIAKDLNLESIVAGVKQN